MAKIKINVIRAISIPTDPGDRKEFRDVESGVHEIDESLLQNWRIRAFIDARVITFVKGKAAAVSAPKPSSTVMEKMPVVEELFPKVGTVTINHIPPKPEPENPKSEEAEVAAPRTTRRRL